MRVTDAPGASGARRTAQSVPDFVSVVRNLVVTLGVSSLERLKVKTAFFPSKQAINNQDYFGFSRYVELIEVSALRSGWFSSVVNLRIVPCPLCLPDDYLRSMEPPITIVVGCMC
jgi:hypothetical protein